MQASRKDYQLSTQDNEEGEGEDLNYDDNDEQLEEEYYNNYYNDA